MATYESDATIGTVGTNLVGANTDASVCLIGAGADRPPWRRSQRSPGQCRSM